MINNNNKNSRKKNTEKINENNINNKNENMYGKEIKISKSVSIETFSLIQEKNMKIVSLVIHLPSNHFRKVRNCLINLFVSHLFIHLFI